MKRSTKISEAPHKFLIEIEIDEFSVVELRDAFISPDKVTRVGEATKPCSELIHDVYSIISRA